MTSRAALLERVLQFDPTEFPAMERAAIECATWPIFDPVALLEACHDTARAGLEGELRAQHDAGTVLGIDPGLSGAWAVVTTAGVLVDTGDLPTIGTGTQRRVDAANFAALMRELSPARAVIEAVSAMPKQGVSSTFRFGQALGTVAGIVGALEIPVTWATPSSWKRAMGLSSDGERSRQVAIETWPSKAGLFARKKDHNRAEAALLALWSNNRRLELQGAA